MSCMRRYKRLAVFLLIISFAFVSLAIDFFHNHKTIQEPASCPAGQFLKIFLSSGIPLLIILVLFIILKTISAFYLDKYKSLYVYSRLSRSPPLV